jgi:two-component sensor histidine kinase
METEATETGWVDHATRNRAEPAHDTPSKLLLDDLLSRQPLLVAINLVVAAAVMAALRTTAPPVLLAAWFGYLLLVQLARMAFWLRQRHRPGPGARRQHPRWLTVISTATGLSWGLAGVLFGGFEYDDPATLVIPFVLAGMSAAAITALPSHPPSFFTFVWAALLPYGLRLATEPAPVPQLMAFVTLVYALGISIIGWQVHRMLWRTVELRVANASLSDEVAERRRLEQQRELLLHELNHRFKNMLAMVLAIAYQTRAQAGTADTFIEQFEGRLQALAAAHELLTATGWHGASLVRLVRRTLEPHLGDRSDDRLRLEAEDLPLQPEAAQNLALALHELATNAVKHGAFSVPGGRVELIARLTPSRGQSRALELVWREVEGPAVRPPQRHGFGTTLLSRAIGAQHQGEVELDWRAEGLVCRISLPESEVIEPSPS